MEELSNIELFLFLLEIFQGDSWVYYNFYLCYDNIFYVISLVSYIFFILILKSFNVILFVLVPLKN